MANKVTLEQFTVKHSARGTVPRYVVIAPTVSFVDLDGEFHVGLDQSNGNKLGDWFQFVEVSDVGFDTYASVAFEGDNALSATIWNNEDTGAAYNIYLTTAKFKILKTIAENIKISDGLDTTTLANLKSSSLQRGFFRPFFSYVTETDLALLTNLAVKATNLVYGAVRLSTPAVNPLIPIVVGNNDTRIPTSLSANYDNSLSDAITEIGADNKDLLITENTTVSASLTVPANIRLNITNNALVSVSSGQTLTVNSLENPGNRQVFTGSGTVRLMPRAAERLNVVWWCGTDTSLDHTSGFQKAFANLTSNDGGTLFIPEGVWKVKELVVPSNSVIEGAGVGRDGIKGTTLQIANVASASWILKVSENFRQIVVRDLGLSTAASTTSSAFLLEGTAPNSGAGLELSNVLFSGTGVSAPAQFYLKDLGGTWEAIQVSFNHCTWLVPQNGKGFRCDTINTAINFNQPFFFLSPGSTGAHINSGANINFTNPTWNGTGTLVSTPVYSRTLNVDAVNGSTVVTLNSGSLTLNDLGAKVVVPGKLDSYIKVLKSTTIAEVETAATATISDDDMELSYLSPNSGMAYAAINLLGSHGTITISGSQDEGLQYFIVASGSQQQYPIGIINSNIQSVISLQGTQTLFSSGNSYFSQSIIDGASSTARIISIGDYVDRTTLQTYTHVSGSPTIRGVELDMPYLLGLRTGAMILQTSLNSNQDNFRQMIGMPTDIKHGAEYSGNPEPTVPVFGLGSAFSKQLFRLGRLDPASNEFDFYYDIERLNSGGDAGRLSFTGNQSGFKGYNFDSNVKATSVTRSTATALTSSSTIALDASTTDIFTLTPGTNATLNISGMKAYQEITLKVLTSGTTSYTLTFGTNFAPTAPLITGTVSGKSYLVKFWTDGTTVFPSNKSNDVGDTDVRVNTQINVKSPSVAAAGDGTTDDRTVLNTLVNTTLATKGGDVFFPHDANAANTDYAINSNITFPANVNLKMARGVRLKIANGVTVTILGGLDCGFTQCFSLTGTARVDLRNAKVERIYLDWFGGVANNTDTAVQTANVKAINSAIESLSNSNISLHDGGGEIFFPTNQMYYMNGMVNAQQSDGISLVGAAMNASGMTYTGTGETCVQKHPDTVSPDVNVSCFINLLGATNFNATKLAIYYNNASFTGHLALAGWAVIEDPAYIYFRDSYIGGIGGADDAESLISFGQTLISGAIKNKLFSAKNGVTGAVNNAGYSNIIEVDGNTFNRISQACVWNPAETWIINGNTVQSDGASGVLVDSSLTYTSRGITISNNWSGDANAALTHFVRLQGEAITLFGNKVDSNGFAMTFLKLQGCTGVSVTGNVIQTTAGIDFGVAGSSFGVMVTGNQFNSATPFANAGNAVNFSIFGNNGFNTSRAGENTFFVTGNLLSVSNAVTIGTTLGVTGATTLASVNVGTGTTLTKILRGSVTIDPASVAATTFSTQTFTLTGAATGDSIVLNPPTAGLTAGIIVSNVYVSAPNTVSVSFYNTTLAAIDLASASWTYLIHR